jgi:hypothetical protein
MSELKLVFEEPKQRKKAPEHLADLTKDERRKKAESLGLPAFRANPTISLITTMIPILGVIFQPQCAR